MGGEKKPKRNFSSLGLIMFKDKSSFLYQASIWAVPRIPILKSMNLATFYLRALKGSSTLSIIHFFKTYKTKEYIFHMFVTCFSQVPLPALSTADLQWVCRAWPWKSLVLAVHFYFICAQPLPLFVSTEQPGLKISSKWNLVSQIPSYRYPIDILCNTAMKVC